MNDDLRLRFRNAAREAEIVVRTLGIASLPVDPFEIAKQKGIEVRPKPADAAGVSGFLMHQAGQFGIAYATHIKNEGFIRFTVAHELGHYFLDGHAEHLFHGADGLHPSRSGFVSDDPIELEADHFASALLMPEQLFRPASKKAGSGFAAIAELSSLCQTSITATAIRFTTFSDDPVAIFVSSGTAIEYCFLSDSLSSVDGLRWPRKRSPVPPDSATARFNRSASNVSEGRRKEDVCELDEWLEGAPPVEVNEDVVGLGSYGKTLTVLFTEKPLATADDDPDDLDDD